MFSDASDIAAGAYTVEVNENFFHKTWSKQESVMSSTWRELKAIQLALESFAGAFMGKRLLWHTDNQNCVRLYKEAVQKFINIFSKCIENSISFSISWIPKIENTKADYLSNLIDNYEDWLTTEEFLCFVDSIWGPHTGLPVIIILN